MKTEILHFRPEDGLVSGKRDLSTRINSIVRDNYGGSAIMHLALIGSLAGFAVHMTVRELAENNNGELDTSTLNVIETKNGQKFYSGNLLNYYLAESKRSLWWYLTDRLEDPPVKSPDLVPIFKRTVQTMGSPDFGRPQLPNGHELKVNPLNLVKTYWPALSSVMDLYANNPHHKLPLLALCARDVMQGIEPKIDTDLSLKILMECAVPMSKIGPEWLE